MPKIKFENDFRYRPTDRYGVTIKYPPGEHIVNQDCIEQAKAKKRGTVLKERKVKGKAEDAQVSETPVEN